MGQFLRLAVYRIGIPHSPATMATMITWQNMKSSLRRCRNVHPRDTTLIIAPATALQRRTEELHMVRKEEDGWNVIIRLELRPFAHLDTHSFWSVEVRECLEFPLGSCMRVICFFFFSSPFCWFVYLRLPLRFNTHCCQLCLGVEVRGCNCGRTCSWTQKSPQFM